ncbi:ubiquitin-conjugating enzyme E2 R1 [Tupaia chinensis]|uniref:ubiquitin-conjugating enzyme E2 R1 n=1 Tax=Tupaia chinensis TaxID=246437 RepID=UPI0003C8D4CC|nr:ubiquitin-conjugating enzyme E2 R1 [Tupaia chinensis]
MCFAAACWVSPLASVTGGKAGLDSDAVFSGFQHVASGLSAMLRYQSDCHCFTLRPGGSVTAPGSGHTRKNVLPVPHREVLQPPQTGDSAGSVGKTPGTDRDECGRDPGGRTEPAPWPRPLVPSSQKALLLELKGLQEEPVEGFRVTLVDEGDLYNWEVAIFGPPNTYYEGGYFKARLKFPIDYPYSPPAFRFLTKMWHPNIYETGDVCISILHPPVDDPQSGELPSERWNPTQNVRTILLSVISLLNEPNTFSPANVDASVMYRKWKESRGRDREYTDIIRKQVLGTKVDAERDGVKVPTTLAEYCVKTKAPAPDEADLFYDDYYEDGEVEAADSCFGDDDSGTEDS